MSARGPQLTARDRVLLQTVASLRVLTTDQLQRLLFPSAQIALRRLRRLADAGLIRLDQSPASAHRLVTLTPAGHEKAGLEAQPPSAIRRRRSLFLQHQLGVNAFRLALGRACASRSDLELLGFIADNDGNRSGPEERPNRMLKNVLGIDAGHVPDGMFALRRGERSALFFFEFDRGTEVIGNRERGLGRIIHSYLGSFASGSYGRATELFRVSPEFRNFRTLVVTTTAARVGNIRAQWSSALGPIASGKRFIWLTTAAALESADILCEPWVSLDASDARTYVILGDRG